MRRLGTLIAVCLLALGTGAYAEDEPQAPSYDQNTPPSGDMAGTVTAAPVGNTKENYPGEFLNRPLILPPWMAQPGLVFGVTNTPGLTGTNLTAAFDIGLMEKLQAGAAIQFPLNNPDPDFGLFFANLQYGVLDFLNVRLDLGAVKILPGTLTAGGSTGFAFGIGAPAKYKLTDMFAITSGRPYAWAFADDIVSMNIVSVGNTTQKFGRVHIPLGVLAQLHPMVAAAIRVGFASTFADGPSVKYVPIGVDLMVNAIKPLDVGFSFDLPGQVDPSGGYADLRLISVWAAYRI